MPRVFVVFNDWERVDEMRVYSVGWLGARVFLESRYRYHPVLLPSCLRVVSEVIISFEDESDRDAEHVRRMMWVLKHVYHSLRQRHWDTSRKYVELIESGTLKQFLKAINNV
ncbi:MAG: hypothetical protein GXO43_06055 [Crenarchaeota archaeon]|nr:hypothetical protein [Thermoproteota archaeon]